MGAGSASVKRRLARLVGSVGGAAEDPRCMKEVSVPGRNLGKVHNP